jgi:hypothetical protein
LLPAVPVEATSPALIEQVRTVVTGGQGQHKVADLRRTATSRIRRQTVSVDHWRM